MLLKRLTILIASFNDARIVDAIKSVRRFDDIGTTKILIVDGGSRLEIRDIIAANLQSSDIFIHEADRGIFDGLNKGLALCDTEYMGWLGSDDRFSGQVLASDVIRELDCNDLFIANVAFFKNDRVSRITYSLPAKWGLVKYGFHNPHYATFGRTSLLASERFDLTLMGSDVDYFHRIFDKKPRVATSPKISTLQFAGGYSNSSYRKILAINWQLMASYARHNTAFFAPLFILLKLLYKMAVSLWLRVSPIALSKIERQPDLLTKKTSDPKS